MGRMGRAGGTDANQKSLSMFFILVRNIEHVYIYLYTKYKLPPTFLRVSKFDIKLGMGVQFSHLQLVGDFSIFRSKSSHVLDVILN